VDRVGKDPPVAAENGVGPIPLVGVGVGDKHAQGGVFGLQITDGDSDVVEHAIAEAAIGEGMVRATGKVGGHAVVQGMPAGGYGRCRFE